MTICLLLSAGQGPAPCQRAVRLAAQKVARECEAENIDIQLVDIVEGVDKDGWRSVVCVLNGEGAERVARAWTGTVLWIFDAREGASRKNWYVSGSVWRDVETVDTKGIVFESCKSSGAGGQHVNTTNSAVRATHTATGLSVKIQSERSQHANKATAVAVLTMKIQALNTQQQSQQTAQQRLVHHSIERGNPIRVFEGAGFRERR